MPLKLVHSKEHTAKQSHITLKSSVGPDLSFSGILFAKASSYDEKTQTFTSQKIFRTSGGAHAISILSIGAKDKSYRAYFIDRRGDTCRLSDGITSLTLPFDSLMQLTQALANFEFSRVDHQKSLARTSFAR
ncbi:hypothetical protein [Desulfobaculum bizertense]|uniref:Uncharacterized protein n=1 Tax=Desulfobaculum bizertense DSM 18034 TaxID=1121442 RepID=A0A1T4WM18_9BACT|nr:hypothetical protein [Desulfobaculum bizertense]SKA77928.1 hypothetical protein SAMN02745702_02396 [Desulfobaculum bizertense DSM 18034]